MNIDLAIGEKKQSLNISDKHGIQTLVPNERYKNIDEKQLVKNALDNPIGSLFLSEIVNPGEKVAIVTSDITRPLPSYKILPDLLKELYRCGIKINDITIVFGLGSHRRHTKQEMRKLVGDEVFNTIRCIDSSEDDFVSLGKTSFGTPVDIAKTVAKADRKICLANVEYHYFAGYSGGAKSIMPGVSTKQAIQSNHSMMINPLSCAGNLETNPVRQDIEQAGGICGIDYIVNVVLNEHKEIIYAVSGDAIDAHRDACRFLDSLYQTKIKNKADIVIVSQGGAPKDINLYQTQKALDNAKHAVKKGGTIILVGSCKEGLGEEVFEQWLKEANCPNELIARIEKNFTLGGHKAAAIAMVLDIADIYLVSELDEKEVEKIFLKPYQTVQNAYDSAVEKYGEYSEVIVMPFGGSTLPLI